MLIYAALTHTQYYMQAADEAKAASAPSSSRVTPQGNDIIEAHIKIRFAHVPWPFLVTGEHGITFQRDLQRGTGTCKHLRSFLLLHGKDLQNKARPLDLSFSY